MLVRIISIGVCLGIALGWIWSAPAGEAARPDAITVDGGRYFGPLVKGRMHGKGRIEWDDGASYEGDFVDGVFSGHGLRKDLRGFVHEGQFKSGLANGQGRFREPDGTKYVGEFLRDGITGTGRYTRPDGVLYEGQFRDWRFHGQGRYTDAQKFVYEGTFESGDLTGKAQIVNPSGGSYEGEVKNWRPHGQGVMRHANGDVYTGGFSFGVYKGKGELVFAKPQADGRMRDEGEWRYGELQDPVCELKEKDNVERALYHQRRLLDRAISELQPADPKRINLYLLAVAGDGSQEVFRREVEFVQRQFTRDFGASGRTLALVNSRHTGETQPMATLTSIREGLAAIAARMDKSRDILMLFITSHGSQTHEIMLDQSSMRLRDLPAAELGRLVKETGIRWKVIVLSACYSGGFIDALKDDHSLIITAARHDRQSFGCSDDNDFTFFGRAFFKEALPASNSFQAAFHTAEGLVRGWERKEVESDGKSPEAEYSYPQMVSPPAVSAYLRRWWAQKATGLAAADWRGPLSNP